MSGTTSIPVVMTTAGAQPTPPATLNAALISNVAATNPDYTVLPGGLIEDISSTDTGALVAIDQARVDSINNVTPLGANSFVLAALGEQFGIPQGTPTNTNVYVLFSGSAGYQIPPGFLVSDGTYQYATQDGATIASTGTSQQVYAIATSAGTWAVPAGSVTEVITSVPSEYTVTVTNPEAGTPSLAAETVPSYRSRVLLAGQAATAGLSATLKTALLALPGVSPQLVSVRQLSAGYEVICGGGDADQVAGAIYESVPDITSLQASVLGVLAVTQANPGVVTTNLNHGYATGQVVTFADVGGMTELNTGNYTITVITPTTFSVGVNTTDYTAYTSGGVVSPNLRNITATIYDVPDSYNITFVNPPQQVVTVAITWNTTLANFTAGLSVDQAAIPAIVAYINGIYVGNPINLLQMTAAFQTAIASVLAAVNLTTLEFAVTINGISVSPEAGTSIIASDPESYFYCSPTGVTCTQG